MPQAGEKTVVSIGAPIRWKVYFPNRWKVQAGSLDRRVTASHPGHLHSGSRPQGPSLWRAIAPFEMTSSTATGDMLVQTGEAGRVGTGEPGLC